jgi:hypothetical protein
MATPAVEPRSSEAERAELESVLQSHLFVRSPTLAHLLTYLCERKFAGESDHIKEYSVALDVFGRGDSFDQDTDSIVRVQANRLRKKLAEYYATEGATHSVRIAIPVGQYVPVFEQHSAVSESAETPTAKMTIPHTNRKHWLFAALAAGVLIAVVAYLVVRGPRSEPQRTRDAPAPQSPMIGLPVGDEIRILAGSTRSYVDRAGKQWSPDVYCSGGSPVRTPIHNIWRTQDPTIFRTSRAGDFRYDIPLKSGIYEVHLYFAETTYGPENDNLGGEGSRLRKVTANGSPLLENFDVIADAGSARTADVKVFTDIAPASDGKLHLGFSSTKGGSTLSAIEILPGTRGRIRPVRILARDTPYYSNDSHWWSPDTYFKGGQLSSSEVPADQTDDPELFETSRWGHFSYAIPVAPGEYDVNLYFIASADHHSYDPGSDQGRPDTHRFNVFCNGRSILEEFDIVKEAGYNRPLVKKVSALQPNAQGKLLLEFVPITDYATVTAIEVLPR